jgi:ATP-dependent helicase HrpB
VTSPLPIDALLPDVIAALWEQPNLVLRAPTGAGKTTRVPPALLDTGLLGTGQLVLLEPRRLAARAAARRMATERNGRLGDEIGYQVRFDRRSGPQTRLLAVTPGILLRRLLDDAFLENVSTVVFDEFHERGLESDLALGMVRLLQQTVRPDLRIVVMSATLAADPVASYLGGCPIRSSEGRSHPVQVIYQARPTHEPVSVAATAAVRQLLDQTPGDLLVFLPGLQEIRQTDHHLEELAAERDLAVLPLHGDLPLEQQDAALLPQARRKVVLATNVAESSVTVEGITGVVDTGLARILQFDPHVGLDRLRLMPISRASADQRAGRAGRTRRGVCLRLWSEANHRVRPEQTEPEIRRVDLAGALLQLLSMGEDIAGFPWLELPQEATVAQALILLRRLGAVHEQHVTDLGQALARLPVHPRLGRFLIDGQRFGQPERAALAAALLSERDPFPRTLEAPHERQERHAPTPSDVLDRVEALEAFERQRQKVSALGTLHPGAARNILRARDQLVRLLRQETSGSVPVQQSDDGLLRALLGAFPDRLARRRQPGGRRGVMVGGRGVHLARSSGVLASELFLCIDVDAGAGEALVRQASAVQRDWLSADQLQITTTVLFDESTEKVVARRRLHFEDLVIEETPAAFPDEEQVAQVLADAAGQRLERVLPPPDSPAGRYLTRLRCLQQWLPELHLPEFQSAELQALLPWLCAGARSFADLRTGSWLPAFQSRLSPAQRQAVDREAPERLQVPSGSRLALQYEVGRPPVLAVRIQELFGLRDTPRLAGGRVPVLLHLLAPSGRPEQVTDDLASFWNNVYPTIRKSLRARYPRHAWPEDPWTATAESRPRRKPS